MYRPICAELAPGPRPEQRLCAANPSLVFAARRRLRSFLPPPQMSGTMQIAGPGLQIARPAGFNERNPAEAPARCAIHMNILIVDDEASLRRTLRIALESMS